jgi:hypothetical protein
MNASNSRRGLLCHSSTQNVVRSQHHLSASRNGELAPNPRRVLLIDDVGNEIPPSAQAQATLTKLRGATPPLSRPLPPGKSYVTDFIFDIPANVHNPRLFVGDNFGMPDRLLIGHENSYFHKKIYLGLSASQEISAGVPEYF